MQIQNKKLWIIRFLTILLLAGSSYVFSLKFYKDSLVAWEAALIVIPMAPLVYMMFEYFGAVFLRTEKFKTPVVLALFVGVTVFSALDFSQGNYVINTGREKKLQQTEISQQTSLDTSKTWLSYQAQNLSGRKKLEAKVAKQTAEIEALQKKERAARWRYARGDSGLAQAELLSVQAQLNNLVSSRTENEKALVRMSDALETEKARRQANLEAKQANLRQAGLSSFGSDFLHVPSLMIVVMALVMAIMAAHEAQHNRPVELPKPEPPPPAPPPEAKIEQVIADPNGAFALADMMLKVYRKHLPQKEITMRFGLDKSKVSRMAVQLGKRSAFYQEQGENRRAAEARAARELFSHEN